MGSLPNLHELEEIERKRELRQEREHRELLREQREQQARDNSRERERMAMFSHRKVSVAEYSGDEMVNLALNCRYYRFLRAYVQKENPN